MTWPTGDRTTISKSDGLFSVDNLIPGTYSVKVEQKGFKKSVANNLNLYLQFASDTKSLVQKIKQAVTQGEKNKE